MVSRVSLQGFNRDLWYKLMKVCYDFLGYENTTLEMYRDIIQSTEVVMLFMTMMLAAEGWCVLRPRIRNIRCLLIPGRSFINLVSRGLFR